MLKVTSSYTLILGTLNMGYFRYMSSEQSMIYLWSSADYFDFSNRKSYLIFTSHLLTISAKMILDT